jgi:soluble lytic murein transglycosylase
LGQYMEVIKLSTKSWQSSVSLSRMLEIIPRSEFKPGTEERLLISEALYHNSKYKDALLHLEALLREKLPQDKKISAHTFLIKNYVRTNRINKADSLIGLYANTSNLYRKFSRVKADELWSMRRRDDAIAVYQALTGKERDEIFKHALKRIGIYSERRKSYNFEGQLAKYIELYPDDDTTEFFLWLLAKNQLRSNNFSSSRKFLESAVSRFPNGRYSDRVRFWLYKIYIQEQRFDDADKLFKALIVQNPGSSYTWTLLDRVIKKYDLKKIQSDFNSSIDKKDKNEALFYHTLLYVLEGDISKRDVRLKKIFSRWEDGYERFIKVIDEFDLGSKYKDRLKGVEKYFAIGYGDAIGNELDILPDEEEVIRDEALTLSCFGERYENYYLTTLYTLQLLKHYNLRENILLLSTRTIKRLFPQAFKACVQKNCDRYKIDRELVYSVIKAESLFNHRAVSPAGAVGLMQLMPRTARGLARELKIKRYDLFEPCISIAFGVKYLSWLNNLFKGNFEDIIGGYNAGAGNIIKWKNTLKYSDPDLFTELVPFEETRFYILRTRKFLFQYRLVNE